MELGYQDIEFIKRSFSRMRNINDFLSLINHSKELIFGEKTKPITLRQLNFHKNPKLNSNRYKRFTIKKKSGKPRVINSPNNGLKAIQKCLNLILQLVYDENPAATGFVPGKSIVDNAKVHTGSHFVFNIDLKDFFSSIDQARVWGRLQHPPFNLNKKNKNIELANIIASLTCHEFEVERLDENNNWYLTTKSVLPQGAPTSPTLSNIICQQLDYYLNAVGRRFGLRYTRYADDITFSSFHNVYKKGSEFNKEVSRIINEQNFHINENKTRLQREGYRQEVTGITVNEKPNLRKGYVKQIRKWLYYWETYGYNKASLIFSNQYSFDVGYKRRPSAKMELVIRGKLNYLRMVKGVKDNTYLKLQSRFDKLLIPLEKEDKKSSVEIKTTTKYKLPHIPEATTEFLRLFKFEDGSGFKELVHDTNLEEFTPEMIVRKVKEHPVLINAYSNEKVSNFKPIHSRVWGKVRELVDAFEKYGVEFYLKTKKHPFEHSAEYTEIAKKFKKNYRFGSGNEYKSLANTIIAITKEEKYGNLSSNIEFLPNRRIFDIRANFYTWTPSIEDGLKYFFDGIKDHGNTYGEIEPNINNIQISCWKSEDKKKVFISILDSKSLANKEKEIVLKSFKESTSFKNNFKSLCNWTVEGDFHDGAFLLHVLTETEPEEVFKKLKKPVEGFKHILEFVNQ